MPKSATEKKERTREYLELLRDGLKKLVREEKITNLLYVKLFNFARSASGGRTAARNRAMRKMWINGIGVADATNAELVGLLKSLDEDVSDSERTSRSVRGAEYRICEVVKEMDSRDLLQDDDPVKEKIAKGFINGTPEAGFHAHTNNRLAGKTMLDGPHQHIFILPGTGDLFVTHETGPHEHIMGATADVTSKDGKHSHSGRLPSGEPFETRIDGDHSHAVMVETTGFDGPHKHELVLKDGTVLTSKSAGEYVELFSDVARFNPQPMPKASEITRALDEVRFLRSMREVESERPHSTAPILRDLRDLTVEMAKTGEAPKLPSMDWEVVDVRGETVECEVGDGTRACFRKGELDVVLGDVVQVRGEGISGFSKSSERSTPEQSALHEWAEAEIERLSKAVDFVGPKDAPLVFIAEAPSALEVARQSPLVGPVGAVFQEQYLTPLGLKKSDVGIGFVVPVQTRDGKPPSDEEIELWQQRLVKSLSEFGTAKVVSLGKEAKRALGGIANWNLSHPAAIRHGENIDHVARDVRKICKFFDNESASRKTTGSSKGKPILGKSGTTLVDAISELEQNKRIRFQVAKSSSKKRIIYSVVTDPYSVDLQDDWIPPSETEDAAHSFQKNSRIIGLEHEGKTDAALLETSLVDYPPGQYELAMDNKPHKVYRQKYGDQVIHSGTWIAGIELSPELWEMYEKGELDALSIGGFSFKTRMTTAAMPELTYIDR